MAAHQARQKLDQPRHSPNPLHYDPSRKHGMGYCSAADRQIARLASVATSAAVADVGFEPADTEYGITLGNWYMSWPLSKATPLRYGVVQKRVTLLNNNWQVLHSTRNALCVHVPR